MKLSIVVPDGSMQEAIMSLFAKAGLTVTVSKERTKEGLVAVDWIEKVVFQRPQEIPHYLNNGHFDVAIVGEDWIENWGYKFPVLLKLPIGRNGNESVKIVLAVGTWSSISKLQDLPPGSEIATEYVELAKRFFAEQKMIIRVVPSFGNTEHKVRYGATGIIDVTESGESLRENNLKIIHTIMESQTVIVTTEEALSTKKFYIDTFTRLVHGAAQAARCVMLTANVPEEILDRASSIIGGLKGPTCSPLLNVDRWFSLQSIVPRSDEHKVILELLKIGVTDIIVNRDIPLIMSQVATGFHLFYNF